MLIDEFLAQRISLCSQRTADPQKAGRGLNRLADTLEDADRMRFLLALPESAALFSASQFLTNYATSSPEALFSAVGAIDRPVRGEWLRASARESLTPEPASPDEAASTLRAFKRYQTLCITLRYLTGRADIIASMEELTALAEVSVSSAFQMAGHLVRAAHGGLRRGGERIAVIALGKMGGMELNYSSDIDLIAVYDRPAGRTSGLPGPNGVLTGRIESHEYHVKVVETASALLSRNTSEGIAFRVDWRLRPQGQRGELAMPLEGYRRYYKTYGRTWERLALIRARPVAGDEGVGRTFMADIEPFVWHRTFRRVEFEEIRALKKRMDGHGGTGDIKRGYGGIREAEFFVQVRQLLDGHRHEPLRTYRIFNAMQSLRWLGIVPGRDIESLWESYIFLRRTEHHLQMKDDLQTYEIPEDAHEIEALGRHMGFHRVEDYLVELRTRRMKIRSIYNSLLGTAQDRGLETASLLDGALTEREFARYLELQHFRRPEDGASALARLRELMDRPLTMRERELSREVVPAMLDDAFGSENPDLALSGIESFLSSTGLSEARLRLLSASPALMRGIVKLQAMAPAVSGLLSSDPRSLERLAGDSAARRTVEAASKTLDGMLKGKVDFPEAAASFRASEELGGCMHFLLGETPQDALSRRLSHAADLVMRAAAKRFAPPSGCAVIAMGRWGGRELTVGSDLDLVFVSTKPSNARWAENIIRALGEYTPRGIAYSIDTRLRPDGTKGVLCKDLAGYRDYYLGPAGEWEVQALLRARPVAGDCELAQGFMQMARQAILNRAQNITKAAIDAMRGRIIKELADERMGLDIKYGPGGLGEIEFLVQWLQLHNAPEAPSLIVQNTDAAIRRLARHGSLSRRSAVTLRLAHNHMMALLTLMRLGGETVLERTADMTASAARFMGYRGPDDLIHYTEELRERVLKITKMKPTLRRTRG